MTVTFPHIIWTKFLIPSFISYSSTLSMLNVNIFLIYLKPDYNFLRTAGRTCNYVKPIKNTKQNKKGMAASTRDLLIAIGNEQYSKATVSFETYGIVCTSNGLLATVYVKWLISDGNFHSIEIIISSSCMRCHMKAYSNLRIMVKSFRKLDEDWLSHQRIVSIIFSMLKLLLQAILSY